MKPEQAFTYKTWGLLRRIPRGMVTTYKEIAAAIGKPGGARAVGNACNKNPDASRVPCHRVVASSGKLGGYAHGTKKKIELLVKEGVGVRGGKIVDFEKRLFRF